MGFEKIAEDIFKLNIPYEDGFTCVFALNGGKIIVDSGACKDDVTKYIVPSITEMNFSPEYLICSHMHPDHCGGMDELARTFKNAYAAAYSPDFAPDSKKVLYLSDGEILFERYKIITLKGHTGDSVGILDMKTNFLLGADAFQLFGIGRYGTGLELPGEYVKMLEKVKSLNVSAIISSHDYEPCGCNAFGKDEVKNYISVCFDALKLLEDTIFENPEKTAEELALIYNTTHKNLPLLSSWTFQNVINYLFQNGKL